MNDHHCHANDCPIPTDPKLLMCPHHWKLVPELMQARVWSAFRKRKGSRVFNDTWVPYYEAAAEAVEHVARLEGKDPDNNYRRMAHLWKNRKTLMAPKDESASPSEKAPGLRLAGD